MVRFLFVATIFMVSSVTMAECFDALDEIIEFPQTQKVYQITDGDSSIYCNSYEWVQYLKAKKIADADDLDWNSIEINHVHAQPSLISETKAFLQDWAANDYGRQLSLWASLNGITRIHISKTLAAYPGFMMTFNASASSLYTATAQEKFFKLQQILKYTYLIGKHTGRDIYVCDQFDNFSVLEGLLNERFRIVMINLIKERQVMICKSGIVYESYSMVYPENPNYY